MEAAFTTVSQLGQDLTLCRNNSDGKLVVVKRVSYAVSAKEKQQLINEVNTLIKLDYIHIVKYLHYEINKKDVTVDLTIEYCSGGSLEDYLRNLKK
jgi:serine/threonine protein kinase